MRLPSSACSCEDHRLKIHEVLVFNVFCLFVCLFVFYHHNNNDPAQEVFGCGVQLARGFPPRSKWMYGEVFHPAVVPQLPSK